MKQSLTLWNHHNGFLSPKAMKIRFRQVRLKGRVGVFSRFYATDHVQIM